MAVGSKFNIENFLAWSIGGTFGLVILVSLFHISAYEYPGGGGYLFVGNRVHAAFEHALCIQWIVPALAVALSICLVSFLAFLVADVRRDFLARQKEFFQEHGECPLARAVFAKNEGVKFMVPILLGTFCVAMVFLFSLLGDALDPAEADKMLAKSAFFAPILMVPLGLFTMFLGLIYFGRSILNTRVFEHAWAIGKSKIKGMLSSGMERQYHQLPSAEKVALVERAARLGVDPEDRTIRRAAIADYNQRMKEASAQASQMAAATPSVDRKAPSRRL